MANNKDFKVKNGIKPTVYHEGVGTVVSGSVGYSIGSAVYDSKSFSFASQETSPMDITFNGDGTKVYVIGTANYIIYQYSLSTAYDISTASYDSVSFSVSSQDTGPRGIRFNNDGTKLYMVGSTNDNVYQYSLSTAYDVSTASYDSVSFSVSSQDGVPYALSFNSAGTKLYISGILTDTIYQYSLSTAFDLSTASYDSVSLDVSGQDGSTAGIAFNSDGTKMITMGNANSAVFQYSLSTGFDLSTASYDSVSFSVTSQETNAVCMAFNSDGTKMYIAGQANDTIYQYSTTLTTNTLDQSTGSVFEITPTSDIQIGLSNPADSGTVSAATLLLEGVDLGTSYDLANASYDSVSLAVSSLAMGMSFSTDGTSLFIVDRTLDTVVEHTLTTAWDLSTAGSAGSSFSVSGQETNPMEVFFKPDGTKMYVMGTAGDDVNEYNLSTAWNITTASHVQAFSVSAKETYPTGLFFKDDGTKMYITGSDSDSVHEYDLSTAWDVSTASFVQSKDISGQETLPWALFFKDDGTKMFIIGVQGDDVNEYNLSTAWDISTASYNQAFSIASEDTSPSGLYFKSDGSKMYVLGDGNNSVYQYTTGTGVVGATITYDSTIEFAGGTAPTSPAIGDTDILTFSTRDGGTTYQSVLAIDGAK